MAREMLGYWNQSARIGPWLQEAGSTLVKLDQYTTCYYIGLSHHHGRVLVCASIEIDKRKCIGIRQEDVLLIRSVGIDLFTPYHFARLHGNPSDCRIMERVKENHVAPDVAQETGILG